MIGTAAEIFKYDAGFLITESVTLGVIQCFHDRRDNNAGILRGKHQCLVRIVSVVRLVGGRAGSHKQADVFAVLPFLAEFLGSAFCVLINNLPILIKPAAGDGDVGVPVKAATVRMNGAENADIQPALSARVEQIIDSQTAEASKQPAVDFKQGHGVSGRMKTRCIQL